MNSMQFLILSAVIALCLWGFAFALVSPLYGSGGTVGLMHLLSFYGNINSAGALTNVAPVADQAIRSTTTGFIVPGDISSLIGEAALSAQTGPGRGQLQSPSLRAFANQDIHPIVAAIKFGGNPAYQWHGHSPRPLKGNEELDLYVTATGGAAAHTYGLAFLADGPVQVEQGNIFSVYATGAAALAAGTWVNTALTFGSTLPAGTYKIVGFRAQGANLIAARFALVGAGYRPGVPAVNAVGDADPYFTRAGRMGAFGVFDVNQPPTVDCLGETDTAQNFVLDLIKVS